MGALGTLTNVKSPTSLLWFCMLLICIYSVSNASTDVYETICAPHPDFPRPTDDERSFDDIMLALDEEFGPVSESAGQANSTILRISNAMELGISVYRVEPDNPIELGYAAVYNNYSTDVMNVRFHVFINEQLQPIGPDGETHLELAFADGELNSFTVTLPPLEEGIYDIVVAAFPNHDLPPGNPDTDPDGWGEASLVTYSMRRTTLVVGDPALPSIPPEQNWLSARTLQPFTPEEITLIRDDQIIPVPYTLIPSLTERPYWWVAQDIWRPVTAGETYETNLLTQYQHYTSFYETYGDDNLFNFALLGFQDDQPLMLGDDSAALYVQMPDQAAKTVYVPITLTAPEEPGRYDLVFFKIDHPGVPLCRLTEAGRADEGVEGVRVAIEVLEP